MKTTKDLVDSIKTIKSNSDYRITDVIYKYGYRWENSAKKVLSDPIYDNTILKNYLTANKFGNVDLSLLKECVIDFKDRVNSSVPDENEIVVHLRSGDVVEVPWFQGTQTTYIQQLKKRLLDIIECNSIQKITIVTCFAYQAWSADTLHLKPPETPDWSYSEDKQKLNIETITNIIDDLSNSFDQTIQVQSSENPDDDLVYCTFANYFVEDFRRSGSGGFSMLLKNLNSIRDAI